MKTSYIYSPHMINERLNKSIDYVISSISCYTSNPVSDFTRSRKLPVKELIKFLIFKQNASYNSELSKYFINGRCSPTASALSQQRKKLDSIALKRISDIFIQSFDNLSTFKDYRILAADGSDINIPFDIHDKETLCNNQFNQFHLNALFDCLNEVFIDFSIDSHSKKRETNALENMVNNVNYPTHSIILADRGYESYNLFATFIENDQKFLVRAKDVTSNGTLQSFNIPHEGSFDVNVSKILTRKQTKDVKQNKDIYTFMPSNCDFDYFDDEGFYPIHLRVVRIQLDNGEYECLITNLTKEEFNNDELKHLYHLRWNEETGFRTLKYTIGMLYFTSKKRELIKQEIYAAIIMMNYCKMMTHYVEIEKDKKRKYNYKINFTTAVTNIRNYMIKSIDEDELIKRIKKFLVPVRPERSYERNVKPQSAKAFVHRVG